MMYVNTLCHSERSEESRYHKVDVTEILPPSGRLNDIICIRSAKITPIKIFIII